MHLVRKVSNNLLECFGHIICVCIDIVKVDVQPCDCCLSGGDNSLAVSWLHLTRFCGVGDEAHGVASRKIATLFMGQLTCLHLQHFKGKFNVAEDSLSRNHHIPN